MRITHPSPGEAPARSGDQPEYAERGYIDLMDRCQNLEAGHDSLREQMDKLLTKKEKHSLMKGGAEKENSGQVTIPGFFRDGRPYKKILDSMGHAVLVFRTTSWEILYWNRPAENLYGWKAYEVIGRRVSEVLIAEEYYPLLVKVMEGLSTGQQWSGQFPFKKCSGEIFMAMVTQTPFYEDGKMVGIITVSSDAALFNSVASESLRRCQENANRQREWNSNWKNIPKQQQLPFLPLAQFASSVSNLASKLRLGGQEEACNSKDKSREKDNIAAAEFEKPGTLVLAKLNIGGNRKHGKEDDNIQQDGPTDTPLPNDAEKELPCRNLKASKEWYKDISFETSSKNSRNGCNLAIPGDSSPSSGSQVDSKLIKDVNEMHALNKDFKGPRKRDINHFATSEATMSSHGSTGEQEYEICWEDIQLGEEIGQGSSAIVYRGLWNGSDVAVKVYFVNDYSKGTLEDYRKEVDIMKKLRHPNVLLYMGAVYSPERHIIVTEFLPRGSLFKILHKNNQTLDIKRRLRMALDVARGMNYLHRRSPPIIHRDLKSSNLLVDKMWSVKVGDFGLSKLKDATFFMTKSGKGTPQWMAPEILRNEPSNEKSDVYSFGVILWELMTGSVPWKNLNSLQVVGVVGFMDRRLDLPQGLDPQVTSIIQDCWLSNPLKRPSFEDIICQMTAILQNVT